MRKGFVHKGSFPWLKRPLLSEFYHMMASMATKYGLFFLPCSIGGGIMGAMDTNEIESLFLPDYAEDKTIHEKFEEVMATLRDPAPQFVIASTPTTRNGWFYEQWRGDDKGRG